MARRNLELITYHIIPTNRRLTFDIECQDYRTIWMGTDDGRFYFKASNGYEVISQSRMDIQTERLWLLGNKPNERSGTMVFSSNQKRDEAESNFHQALFEWNESWMKS